MAHGLPAEHGNLEMLQMTTQQVDDRETVDGVEAVGELADRNARETGQMAGLAKHRQWLSITPGPKLTASISRMAPFKDGKAQPAAAEIGNRLPPINLPLAAPSVVSAEVGSSALE